MVVPAALVLQVVPVAQEAERMVWVALVVPAV
jgi:hypothetical protein